MDIDPNRLLVSPEAYRKALEASEARFRTLIERNADGVIVLRQDGTICYANPAAETLLRRPARELVGHPFGLPMAPGGTSEIDLLCERQHECVAELRVVETVWEDRPALLASLRDVTARKQAERALRFLADASGILAVSLDLATTVRTVARLAVSHLADWCAIDLLEPGPTVHRVEVGHADPAHAGRLGELVGRYPLDAQRHQALADALLSGRSVILSDCESAGAFDCVALAPARGAVVRELGCRALMIVPLAAPDKILGAITLVAADPARHYSESDRTLAEDLGRRAGLALENARLYADSRDAVRRRDEFLAMLAHELRNPLGAVRNAIYIMNLPGAAPEQVARARDVIERQGRHMGRLLDDLLDISRVTRGKIELRKQPVELVAAVAEAVEANRAVLEKDGRHFELTLPRESLTLAADPTRLQQILANLLTNAAKYTRPGGHISLTVTREGDVAVLRVKDDGIGIAPEMLPRVFELFAQADVSLDRAQGGMGIGLTMVRGLVELHGGSVTAHSAGLGRGSEFVVRLPLRPGSADTADRGGRAATPCRRVLIVEDHADGREMLRDLLEMWGHVVDVAPDGPTALAKLLAGPPEVMIVDIGLKGQDGYQLAQRVRASADGDRITLVALTGYGRPEDRRRAFAAGFDAHLVKPVDLGELARVFELAAGGREAFRQNHAPGETGPT